MCVGGLVLQRALAHGHSGSDEPCLSSLSIQMDQEPLSAGASSSADRLLQAFLGFGALAKTPSTITTYGTDISNIIVVSFREMFKVKAFLMFPAVARQSFPCPFSSLYLFFSSLVLYYVFFPLHAFFHLAQVGFTKQIESLYQFTVAQFIYEF